MPKAIAAKPAYKRVLLKLSGEALMGDQKFGLDQTTIAALRTALMPA